MKRVMIIVVLFAAMFGVWYVAFQNHEKTSKPKTQPVEREKKLITLTPTKRELSAEEKNIAHEDDPKGPLTLSGQVRGVDGKPAQGATVSIDANPPRFATTDERGWFFFEGLLGRFYYIEAKKGNAFVGPLGVNLNSVTDPVELQLKSGSALEIMVLQEESTQPVPNVLVVVNTITESSAMTDAQGVAHFFGFGPDYANVHIDAPGYSKLRTDVTIKGTPDQTQKEVIYAKPGSPISGIVKDPSGNPVAGAKILATTISTDYTFLQDGDSAESDAEGKFEISAVPPGGYRLYATHPKYRATLSDAFDVEEKTPSTNHEIQLQGGGILAGKVIDQEDKPVPFANVNLSYERLSMESTEYWDYKKSIREVFCDEKGEFSFEGVAPGNILLRSSAEETTEATLKVALTENEEKRDLVLLLDPGEQIAGKVVTDKGEAIADVEVYASPKVESTGNLFEPDMTYPRSVIAKTNASGEFLLLGLEPGEYYLTAAPPYSTDDAVQYREDIDPTKEQPSYKTGATNVTLVLKKLDTATVKGSIAFEDGGTPESFLVRIGSAEKFVKGDASFLFQNVTVEYAYSISIEGEEFLPIQKNLKLEVNQTLDLGVIKVKRGRTIEGQVVNARNTPIAGAQISIYPTTYNQEPPKDPNDWMPGYSLKSASSDQDGHFVLQGVSAEDDFSISATHPHKGSSKTEKITKGTSKANVTLTIRDGGVLTGHVTRDGKPCRVSVSVYSEGNTPTEEIDDPADEAVYVPNTTSGGDGIYRLERIPEGKYTVDFYRYSDETSSSTPILTKTVTIKDGQTTTLDAEIPVLPTLIVEVNTSQTKEYWWFQLIKGTHPFKTAGQLDDFFASFYEESGAESKPGDYYYGSEDYYTPGIQAKFIDVIPQSYTICVGTSPSYDGEEDYTEDNYRKQKVSCQPIKISPAPEEQKIIITP